MAAVIAPPPILIPYGAGFAGEGPGVAAIALLVLWAIGFVARSTDRRWYRW